MLVFAVLFICLEVVSQAGKTTAKTTTTAPAAFGSSRTVQHATMAVFTLLEGNNVCKLKELETMPDVSNSVESLQACKDLCAKTRECVALTLFHKSKANWCAIYSRFCDNPFKHVSARIAYRIERKTISEAEAVESKPKMANAMAATPTITTALAARTGSSSSTATLNSSTAAQAATTAVFELLEGRNVCQEGDFETLTDISDSVEKLQDCKDLCAQTAKCVAFTMFAKSKASWCSIHSRFCDNPYVRFNARIVYRVRREAIAQKTAASNTALSSSETTSAVFQLLKGNNVCYEKDMVTLVDVSDSVANLQACKDLCAQTRECVALTLYSKSESKWCSIHSQFCDTPYTRHKARITFLVTRNGGYKDDKPITQQLPPLPPLYPYFELVEGDNICERSSVEMAMQISDFVATVSACKDICAANDNCEAIAFFNKNQFCTIYTKFCDNPNKSDKNRVVYRAMRGVTERGNPPVARLRFRKKCNTRTVGAPPSRTSMVSVFGGWK